MIDNRKTNGRMWKDGLKVQKSVPSHFSGVNAKT